MAGVLTGYLGFVAADDRLHEVLNLVGVRVGKVDARVGLPDRRVGVQGLPAPATLDAERAAVLDVNDAL